MSGLSLVLSFYLLSLLTSLQDFLLLQVSPHLFTPTVKCHPTSPQVPMVCSLTLINSILQASLTQAVPQVLDTSTLHFTSNNNQQ